MNEELPEDANFIEYFDIEYMDLIKNELYSQVIGELATNKLLAEQQEALRLMYDPTSMDDVQREKLESLLIAGVLPESDREAAINSLVAFGQQQLELEGESLVGDLEVIAYILENPKNDTWFALLAGYLERGDPLSERQLKSAYLQMKFEQKQALPDDSAA